MNKGHAEKFYEDGSVSLFSVLTNCMTKEAMESWLDQALVDRRNSFQSVLFDKLEMSGEKSALEKELKLNPEGTVNVKITVGKTER